MNILIPEGSLVLLVGISGSGKSTLAHQLWNASQIVSSDHYREVVCDDLTNQEATKDAFEVVHHIVQLRLQRGRTTVVDATNLKEQDRKGFWRLAGEFGRTTVMVIVDTDLEMAIARNQSRERVLPEKVLRRQHATFLANKDMESEADLVHHVDTDALPTVVSHLGENDLSRLQRGYAVPTPAGEVSVPASGVGHALEALERHSVPRGALAYLPPTMAPAPTSSQGNFLEHPREALGFYRDQEVVCEEKHMGSRATFLVCRDETVAAGFGLEQAGAAWTRRGRSFFTPEQLERILPDLRHALRVADVLEDWVLFDAEVLPWNFKEGLVEQFAAVAAAGLVSTRAEIDILERARSRGLEVGDTSLREGHERNLQAFSRSYQEYCWDTQDGADIRIAPFEFLASSSGTISLTERPHSWHMERAELMAASRPDLVRSTRWRMLHTGDPAACDEVTAWWLELTGSGGEGMVVKPLRGPLGSGEVLQPGVKVRGADYLRLIYGPDYQDPERLKKLRQRSLKRKRSLALQEWGLGRAGLDRLERNGCASLECTLGVLALESEKIDPRL